MSPQQCLEPCSMHVRVKKQTLTASCSQSSGQYMPQRCQAPECSAACIQSSGSSPQHALTLRCAFLMQVEHNNLTGTLPPEIGGMAGLKCGARAGLC